MNKLKRIVNKLFKSFLKILQIASETLQILNDFFLSKP